MNEFMSSEKETVCFDLSFCMTMRWGSSRTKWRCLLMRGDTLVIRAELRLRAT